MISAWKLDTCKYNQKKCKAPPSTEILGLGKLVEVREVGEVKQLRADRGKLAERPAITIICIKQGVPDRNNESLMINITRHFYKSTYRKQLNK